MKHTILPVLVLILLSACTGVQDKQVLTPSEFAFQFEKTRGILLDVRTPAEFNTEAIKGAENISVEDGNFESLIGRLDRHKSYFVYCGIGKRSARACSIMKQNGFTSVYDLEGGLTHWKATGMPVTPGSSPLKTDNSSIIK